MKTKKYGILKSYFNFVVSEYNGKREKTKKIKIENIKSAKNATEEQIAKIALDEMTEKNNKSKNDFDVEIELDEIFSHIDFEEIPSITLECMELITNDMKKLKEKNKNSQREIRFTIEIINRNCFDEFCPYIFFVETKTDEK